MHKVGQTILEGIGLVFLILILFLGSPRSALVVAVTIPLALVAVFSLLNLTHVSANLLSLGAIDFGILVDGAIVVTESVLRRREALPDEVLSEDEAKAATLQVTRPIFFASLIIITAYLPMFSFERAEAKLFTPMAYTMGYALFGALLTTLALVPGLAYMAFRKPGRVLSQPLARPPDRMVRPRCSPPAWSSRGSSTASRSSRCSRWWGSGPPSAAISCRISTKGRCGCRCRCPPGLALEQGERHGERSAPGDLEVSRSVLRRHPNRPQRRRHRSLDDVAHRGARRPHGLRHLAGGTSPRSSSWTDSPPVSPRICRAIPSASVNPSSMASTT